MVLGFDAVVSVTDVPRAPFVRPGATSPVVTYTPAVGSAATWTEATSSAAAEFLLTHVSLAAWPASGSDPATVEVGIGAAASEVVVSYAYLGKGGSTTPDTEPIPPIPLNLPVLVSAGQRVSVRLTAGGGAFTGVNVVLAGIKTAQLSYIL